MAKKTLITAPILPQRGPVSAAIRAVREPDAPWFTPVHLGEPMLSGFHVGRRLDWTDPGRSEVVYIDVIELAEEWCVGIYRCGSRTVENPAEWEFGLRIAGIRAMPEEPLELQATILH